MIRASTIIILSILVWSCGQSSETKEEERIKEMEKGEKRALSHFSEEEVAKFAVARFNQLSAEDFEAIQTEDGILVTPKHQGPQREYIKMGGFGLVLRKDKNGKWTDVFDDRQIYYHEEGKKLILAQTFKGDSATVNEFVK